MTERLLRAHAHAAMSAVAENYVLLTGLVFIQMIYVTMVYGPIAAFLVELFPTEIRGTAMGLFIEATGNNPSASHHAGHASSSHPATTTAVTLRPLRSAVPRPEGTVTEPSFDGVVCSPVGSGLLSCYDRDPRRRGMSERRLLVP